MPFYKETKPNLNLGIRITHYDVREGNTLGKGMNPLIPPDLGLILLLLSFYENRFGIKESTKIDMPLNKETKPNQT